MAGSIRGASGTVGLVRLDRRPGMGWDSVISGGRAVLRILPTNARP